MLSDDDLRFIHKSTSEYWKAEVLTPEFRAIATGKEVGHKIGDMVDEKTTALLKVNRSGFGGGSQL